MYSGLASVSPVYFRFLSQREPGSDHHYDWLCKVLREPTPHHPAASPLTRLLGEVAESGVAITPALLSVWDKAAEHAPSNARMFISGAFAFAGIDVPVPPLRSVVAIEDDDDDTDGTPVHCKGTLNGEVQYWREDAPGCITHLYEKKDIDDVATDIPHGFYISDDTATGFVPPSDAVSVELKVSGFYATDRKALYIFPSAANTSAQLGERVAGVIEALMARGSGINRALVPHLSSMTLKRNRSTEHGKCGLCNLRRALTHKASVPGLDSIEVGPRCAEQLDLAIRLSKLKPGDSPDGLLDKLSLVL
jgi:hypothetical protein